MLALLMVMKGLKLPYLSCCGSRGWEGMMVLLRTAVVAWWYEDRLSFSIPLLRSVRNLQVCMRA